MPLPEIVRIAQDYRRRLLANEARALRELTRQYAGVHERLQRDAARLADQFVKMREAGEAVPTWRIMQMQRYQELMRAVEGELARFNQQAERIIRQMQREGLNIGQAMSEAQVEAMLADMQDYLQNFGYDLSLPQVQMLLNSFNKLPADALEQMIGFLADGSPLSRLLLELGQETATQIGDTLVQALALGWNPTRTARVLRRRAGLALTRALRIARTEQLRAFRVASVEGYRQNAFVLKGYRRNAQLDDRTCLACLLKDGEIYELADQFTDHPNGRCAVVPVTKSWAELGFPGVPEGNPEWELGRDWFNKQDEATQRSIMGNALYEAWRGGDIRLDDAIALHESGQWGDHWHTSSLKRAQAAAEQRRMVV